jgi:hypothetical protein
VLNNVSLAGSGTLANQGTLIVQGTSAVNVALTTAAGSTLRVLGGPGGDATLTVANGFANNGMVELTTAGSAAAATLTVGSGTLTNVPGAAINALAGAGGARNLRAVLDNQGAVSVDPGQTLSLVGGGLSNFNSGTLNGGTYNLAGTLQFPGAAIATNAAAIVLDGPASRIVNESQADALVNFATNAAGSSFTVQNGRTFATAAALTFSNAGTLAAGAGSTFAVSGGFSNFTGTTLTAGTYLIGGTFRFTGAHIVTNAATIVMDGPAAAIVDQSGNDGLSGFATNAAAGSFTLANGRNLTTAGGFNNAGSLTIGNSSTLTVTAAYTQTDTGAIGVNGTLNLPAGGSAAGTVANGGSLAVGAGTTFTVSGTYTQAGALSLPATATLDVTGTFSNFTGTTLTAGTYLIGGTFRFAGANIVTNAATIVLDGPAARIVDQAGNNALAGLAVNDTPGSFTIQNGRDFTTAGDFTNNGTLAVGAGDIFAVAGNLTNFASTTLTGGTLVVGGTLKFANADIRTNAARIVLDGSASQIVDQSSNNALANFATNAAGASFTIQNGRNFTTSPAVAFNNASTVVIAAGSTFTVAGTLSNFAGMTLTGGSYVIGGTFKFTDADIRTNAATIVLDGAASQIINQASANALANFSTNTASGSFTIQNGRNFTSPGAFNNAGSVTIGDGSTFTATGGYTQSTGATYVSAGAALTSTGGVNIQGGVLSGSGTINASVTIQNGGTLSGSETINGNVTNAGLIEVGGAGATGVLMINGNYTQTGTGILNIEIGGASAGSGFDQLRVSSTATLGGTLNVSLLNGYVPPHGTTFQILTFGSRGSSTFQTTNIDPAFQDPVYNQGDVTLIAN